MFLNIFKEIKENAENAINTVKDSDTFRQASAMVSSAAETAQALAAEKLGEVRNADSCGKFTDLLGGNSENFGQAADSLEALDAEERKQVADLDVAHLFETMNSMTEDDVCAWGNGNLRDRNVKYTFRDVSDLDWNEVLGYLDATKLKMGYQCILFTRRGILWAIDTKKPEFIEYAALASASFFSEDENTGSISLAPGVVYVYPASQKTAQAVQTFFHNMQTCLWEKSPALDRARRLRFAALKALAENVWNSSEKRTSRETGSLCNRIFCNMESICRGTEEQAEIFFLKAMTARTISECENAIQESSKLLVLCQNMPEGKILAEKVSAALEELRANYRKERERVKKLIHTILERDDPTPLEQDESIAWTADDCGMNLLLYVARYGRGPKTALYDWFEEHPYACKQAVEQKNIFGDGLQEIAALHGSRRRFWEISRDLGEPEITREGNRFDKRIRNNERMEQVGRGASALLSGTAYLTDSVSRAGFGTDMGARSLANEITGDASQSHASAVSRMYLEIDHDMQALYVNAWNSLVEHLTRSIQPPQDGDKAIRQLDEKMAQANEQDAFVENKIRADREAVLKQYESDALAEDKMIRDEFETTEEFLQRKEAARLEAREKANAYMASEAYKEKVALLRVRALDEEHALLISQKAECIEKQENKTKTKELLLSYFIPTPVRVHFVLGSYNADQGTFAVTLELYTYPDTSENTIETTLLMERDIARQFKKNFDALRFEWTCTPDISLPQTGDALEVTLQYQCSFVFLDHAYEVVGQQAYRYEKPVLEELPDVHNDDPEEYENYDDEDDYDGDDKYDDEENYDED